MPVLNIKDPECYRLAAEIAQATGRSLTRVVRDALEAERVRTVDPPPRDMAKIKEILREMDALPAVDPRPIEEIIGDFYEENGLFQ